MHPYARLTPGQGFKPYRAFMYYSQRAVTVPFARTIAANSIAAAIRIAHPPDKNWTPAAAETLSTLRKNGIAMLPELLPQSTIDALLEKLLRKNVIDSEGNEIPLQDLKPHAANAAYPLETILDCDEVIKVANDPMVLGLVASYLHCPPTISSVGIRWSFPNGNGHHCTQIFHRDTDDWKFLKLFIYLSDVDMTSGPHVYVKGSHRQAARLRGRPYTSEDVERKYGQDAIGPVTGPRGTCFLADTFGVHRGAVPTERPRLILQIQYSTLPVFSFLYAPMAASTTRPIDKYVNRLLIAH